MSKNAPNIVKKIFEQTACLSNKQLLAYADNTLSKGEKHNVEKHLIDCPFCAEALDGSMNRTNKHETTKIVTNLNIKIIKKLKSKIYTSTWKRYVYGAAAAFIICVGYLYNNQLNYSDSHNLFNSYFQAYPNIVPILRGDTNSNDLQIAMIEYEKKNFLVTLQYLEKVLGKNANHPEATFYAGISYLCIENLTQAISFLKHAQKIDTELFEHEINWYLGLAYIKNDNINLAKLQFKHLLQTENNYTEISKKILYDLEQM